MRYAGTVWRDLGLAGSCLALAAAYHAASDRIPRSLLADRVGADGVPKLLAVALGLLSVALAVRAVVRRRPAPAAAEEKQAGIGATLKSLGLLVIAWIYVVAAPWLGYVLATALLIAAVALYAGRRAPGEVALVAVGGVALLWLLFVKALAVPMPHSPLARFLV